MAGQALHLGKVPTITKPLINQKAINKPVIKSAKVRETIKKLKLLPHALSEKSLEGPEKTRSSSLS